MSSACNELWVHLLVAKTYNKVWKKYFTRIVRNPGPDNTSFRNLNDRKDLVDSFLLVVPLEKQSQSSPAQEKNRGTKNRTGWDCNATSVNITGLFRTTDDKLQYSSRVRKGVYYNLGLDAALPSKLSNRNARLKESPGIQPICTKIYSYSPSSSLGLSCCGSACSGSSELDVTAIFQLKPKRSNKAILRSISVAGKLLNDAPA